LKLNSKKSKNFLPTNFRQFSEKIAPGGAGPRDYKSQTASNFLKI